MTPEQQATIAEINLRALELVIIIDQIGSSDELDCAIMKVKEAVLWAKAGVEALGGADD